MDKKSEKNIIIWIGVFLIIIFVLSLVISQNKKRKEIDKVFNIILNNNSSNIELEKSIADIEKIKSSIDCIKAINNKNEYYDFCMNDMLFTYYATTKIEFNNLNDNSTFEDYERMYNQVIKMKDEDYKKSFIEFTNMITNTYFNFLVEQSINGKYKEVIDVTKRLSGFSVTEYKETKYSETKYCTSFTNEYFASLYYFASSFDNQKTLQQKFDDYWLQISFKTQYDYEYIKNISDYIIKQLQNNELSYNGNKVVTKEQYEKIFLNYIAPRNTEADCALLLNKYNALMSPPEIGMNKEQVRASAWGEPKRINKTTTNYGTREQWVYSTTKYIYFNESGIVYSIQQ